MRRRAVAIYATMYLGLIRRIDDNVLSIFRIDALRTHDTKLMKFFSALCSHRRSLTRILF